MKSKLYIDVDGVLLSQAPDNPAKTILANHTLEFLKFCAKNFECYWLTTHCKDNSTQNVLKYLSQYANEEVAKYLNRIKPSTWNTLKTEAIDFSSDFFWIDDAPLYYELERLKQKGLEDSFIRINTRKKQDDLLRAIEILQEFI